MAYSTATEKCWRAPCHSGPVPIRPARMHRRAHLLREAFRHRQSAGAAALLNRSPLRRAGPSTLLPPRRGFSRSVSGVAPKRLSDPGGRRGTSPSLREALCSATPPAREPLSSLRESADFQRCPLKSHSITARRSAGVTRGFGPALRPANEMPESFASRCGSPSAAGAHQEQRRCQNRLKTHTFDAPSARVRSGV